MRPSHVALRTTGAYFIALGIALTTVAPASADDFAGDPSMPDPVQVAAVPTSDGADPAAVAACAQFAQVLDGSATYYGEFADSFEGSDYADPAVDSSNSVGRTALREAAGIAMNTSNTPGLRADIADPMRAWSMSATALLVKMGVRMSGDSLNTTATNMNNDATEVQEACAAAGTHA